MNDDLRVHAVDWTVPKDRVMCGQTKMRTRERKRGLRYTSTLDDVTCEKCLAKLEVRYADL